MYLKFTLMKKKKFERGLWTNSVFKHNYYTSLRPVNWVEIAFCTMDFLTQ